MDAISALRVAGGILAVAEFCTDLFSASNIYEGESALDDEDESFILESLKELILGLSDTHVSILPQSSSSASQPSSDALALRELASSCIEDFRVLLEDIGNIPGDSPGRRRSHKKEKVEQLSNAVTRRTLTIIRCAARLSTAFDSLGDTDTWMLALGSPNSAGPWNH